MRASFSSLLERTVFLLFLILSLSAALVGVPLIAYVAGALVIGAFLAWFEQGQYSPISTSSQMNKWLTISCYLAIAFMAVISTTTPTGVPLTFYAIMVIVVGLLTIKITTNPSARILFPIFLLATTIRAAYWFAAPHIGSDPQSHVAIARYVANTGEIIPQSITYYHFYPLGHISSAIATIILDVPERVGFFLSIGLATVVGLVLVTKLISNSIINRYGLLTRSSLFAALYLSIAPFHLLMSSSLIVQSLTLMFVPLSFVAFLENDRRLIFIGILAAGATLLTHNIPGLLIIAFGVGLLLVNLVMEKVDTALVRNQNSTNLVAAIGVGLIYYWMSLNYLEYQVGRIFRILSPGGSLSGAASTKTTSLIPPILYTAIGLLFAGALLGSLGFKFIYSVIQEDWEFMPDYYITTVFMFLGFAFILFIGLDTKIIRLVPFAPLIAAPLIGYMLSRVATTHGRTSLVTVILIMMIIPLSIFSSAAGGGYSVGDAITEDRPGFRQNYLSQSEMSGAITSTSFSQETSVSFIVWRSLGTRGDPSHQVPGVKNVDVMQYGWPESCETFYIRDYYSDAFSVEPSSENDIILDVGDARLATC